MNMLDSNPHIMKFADHHRVEVSELVSVLKHGFGNHVDILLKSCVLFMDDGRLRLYDKQNEVFLNVMVVDMTIQESLSKLQETYILGRVTQRDGHPDTVSVLIII